ncbi:primase-helicase zinc-binding domain-containing protein [Candidatus Magnetaquicoccus inordinatus]|uniref:primase-helicase zinc-binding domain-containing protein n=1 Tax=Candidatus Magnetaquicoccus inordinatus TaxID=2496818 RepID=UPI00102BB759|nr:primase-helicase zinc-binding domain-containing protein [Candidatus Magnetaquicoccus inordinatus]
MNINQIIEQARGHWPSILLSLGASQENLANKHRSCPFCGGKDRFRFDDKDGHGTFICNQCGAGDGMGYASRLLGLEDARDFPKVAESVAKAMGTLTDRDREEAFRREYVRTGNATAAYRSAFVGGELSPESLKQRAARMARKLGCARKGDNRQGGDISSPVTFPGSDRKSDMEEGGDSLAPVTFPGSDRESDTDEGGGRVPTVTFYQSDRESDWESDTDEDGDNPPSVTFFGGDMASDKLPGDRMDADGIANQQLKRDDKKDFIPINQQYAMKLWEQAGSDQQVVKQYLASRSITTELPDTIRFLPSVQMDLPKEMFYLSRRREMMVALVQNGRGDPVAIHHTSLVKEDLGNRRKMMLGPVKGGAVRLGKYIPGGALSSGEGIESCLSFQQAADTVSWSALSSNGIQHIELPREKPSVMYVLADVDEPKIIHGKEVRVGQEAARKAALRIARMGIETYIVWPGDPMGPKVDFNDLLMADPSGESIRNCLKNAELVTADVEPQVECSIDLPLIRIAGGMLPTIVRLAEKSLLSARNNEIFQRAGSLVRIVKLPKTEVRRQKVLVRRDEGALVILPVDQAWIELRLTGCANFEKWDSRRNHWARIDCPPNVSRSLLAMSGDWQFNALAGVIETPTLRPDGSILDQHGYDEETGLYLDTSGVTYPTLKAFPTREDAIESLQFLETALEEFPFLQPHHKSAALAAILTALVRRSLRTAPMFILTAPKMGSGKGLMANVVALIATGRTAAAITHSKDPEEEKKSLFTILVSGDSIALIDNIEHSLGSPALCSILSEETYKSRVLGETREIVVPTSVTWLATGNNLTVKGDLTTRVIIIHIDPAVERPEERTFKRDLKTWIPENRAKLVCAGITVLRAYAVAGRPSTGLPPYGRFEEWGRVVRDALVWCGLEDPCLSRNEVEDDDPVRIELNNFLTAWWKSAAIQVTTEQMIERARFMASPPDEWVSGVKQDPDHSFINALVDIAGDAKGNINKRTLSWYLKRHRGRIEGGLMISVEQKKNRAGFELWSVRQVHAVESAESQSNIESFSYPMRENVNIRNSLYTSCGSEDIEWKNELVKPMTLQSGGTGYETGVVS